ncbi:MAG: transketolase family protein, partial [Methanobacteriota archaeon]
MEKKNCRKAYGLALVELGRKYKNLVVLDADLAVSTHTAMFKKEFPDRFFDVGVAEQNMMDTAAGLATTGKIVFASTFAVFATGRPYDQIRQSIAYPNLPVKIVATHAGVTVGADGASHQTTEDVALMRVLPNMSIYAPADYYETFKLVVSIAKDPGPAYVRLPRPSVPVIFDESYKFGRGKAVVMREGGDVAIVSMGTMLYQCLEAANLLG